MVSQVKVFHPCNNCNLCVYLFRYTSWSTQVISCLLPGK